MLQDVMGNPAQDGATEAAATATTDVAEDAMSEMANQAASMLGVAITVYTVYVVTVAVIQMVYACEQEELEMNTKRATDSCTYVGSYCKDKALGPAWKSGRCTVASTLHCPGSSRNRCARSLAGISKVRSARHAAHPVR